MCGAQTLLVWSPNPPGGNNLAEFKALAELQKLQPGFETRSRYLNLDLGSVFKSPELGNYELIGAFAAPAATEPLPAEIQTLLGWAKQDGRVPGAYPRRP
jgi:hypothetical protein